MINHTHLAQIDGRHGRFGRLTADNGWLQHTIPLQCTDNIAVGCFVYILKPANEIVFVAIQRLCRHICLALAYADIQGTVNDKEVVTAAVL